MFEASQAASAQMDIAAAAIATVLVTVSSLKEQECTGLCKQSHAIGAAYHHVTMKKKKALMCGIFNCRFLPRHHLPGCDFQQLFLHRINFIVSQRCLMN